jgi:Uma2 family endonuclease
MQNDECRLQNKEPAAVASATLITSRIRICYNSNMEQAIPQAATRRYTVAEYFELEAASEEKHEFRDGELIAMAGGTESHDLIKNNLIGELRSFLKNSPCRVHGSDMRLRAARNLRYTYPDVFIVCGERRFDPEDPRHTTLTDAKVVIEVLSPSTEASDRGEKFAYYMQSPALEEYVLVSQHQPRMETLLRQNDGTWSLAFFRGIEANVRLRSLGIDLPLSEVYAKVVFPEPEQPEAI